MKRPTGTVAACAGAVFGLLFAGGCYTKREVGAGRGFPTELTQTSVRDIQVQRHGTHIALTNTSALVLGPGTMWLNEQFAREIEAIEVGRSASFHLSEFTNEFGERFRAGGFFATERPDRLVHAQVEQGGTLVGLIVIGGGEEQ